MMRKSVDFPQPEGPTKTTNSPSPTARSIPFRTSVLPKLLRTPSIVSAPIHELLAMAEEPARLPTSQADRLAGPHTFVGGKAYSERFDRVVHVPRQVHVLLNCVEQEYLLEVAKAPGAPARLSSTTGCQVS